MKDYIKEKLLAVPGVTTVEVTTITHITTILDSENRRIEGEIYAREMDVMRQYPQENFEFSTRIEGKNYSI